MAMPGDEIAKMITDAMPGAQVEMIDLAGDNDHWKAVIIWDGFKGMPRVRQHQAVYAALKGKMGGELHALALETRAE